MNERVNEWKINKALAPFGLYSSANTGSRNSLIHFLPVSLLLYSHISVLEKGFESAMQTWLLAASPPSGGWNAFVFIVSPDVWHPLAFRRAGHRLQSLLGLLTTLVVTFCIDLHGWYFSASHCLALSSINVIFFSIYSLLYFFLAHALLNLTIVWMLTLKYLLSFFIHNFINNCFQLQLSPFSPITHPLHYQQPPTFNPHPTLLSLFLVPFYTFLDLTGPLVFPVIPRTQHLWSLSLWSSFPPLWSHIVLVCFVVEVALIGEITWYLSFTPWLFPLAWCSPVPSMLSWRVH